MSMGRVQDVACTGNVMPWRSMATDTRLFILAPLTMLLDLLRLHRLDAYMTLTSDEHLNEYIGEPDKRVEFLTGFSGSNGIAITCESPVLYTDSRYYIQATNQSKEYKLMRMGEDMEIDEYLHRVCRDKRVGICSRLVGSKRYENLRTKLERRGLHLESMDTDLVDMVWKDRPRRMFNEIYSIEDMRLRKYQMDMLLLSGSEDFQESMKDILVSEDTSVVGDTYMCKLGKIREMLKPGQTFVVTELDTIAWMFNLRGSDTPYNPVFYSYAMVSRTSTKLFVNTEVEMEGVEVYPYDEFEAHVSRIEEDVVISGECNAYIRSLFSRAEYSDGIRVLQSQKTGVEIRGFQLAYVFDGIALTRLFGWIESQLERGVSEREIGERLDEIKREFPGYVQPSFGSIVGGGENGAIVHHKAGDRMVGRDELLLIDSGSQYVFGTTDTTRTLHFGTPSDEERTNFTRVLKGQLRAMRMRCHSTMSASVLDGLSRMDLWREKQNFGHGTGHGVGHFLCVHECPPFVSASSCALKPGQVFSIEPGFYKEGEYGIRIENLVYLKDVGDGFCDVTNLTLVPYQLKLIDVSMLDNDEVSQLNRINMEIRSVLEPLMAGQTGHDFLVENTKAVEK